MITKCCTQSVIYFVNVPLYASNLRFEGSSPWPHTLNYIRKTSDIFTVVMNVLSRSNVEHQSVLANNMEEIIVKVRHKYFFFDMKSMVLLSSLALKMDGLCIWRRLVTQFLSFRVSEGLRSRRLSSNCQTSSLKCQSILLFSFRIPIFSDHRPPKQLLVWF
jgi:hypothetical protein